MPNPNQIAKAIQQKKSKQQRAFKATTGQAKLEQETEAFSQFGLKPEEMDQAQVFIGDKCIQFDKPLVAGNRNNDLWSIRGEPKDVPADSTKYMKEQKQSMDQLMELLQKNAATAQPPSEEEVEENAAE